jgi:2-methylisocitrate lyase-like PEP mutase family enzyme
VLCDADTGFGEAINVEHTVRLLEEAVVAGLHTEDQVLPKRCGHLTGRRPSASTSWSPRSGLRSPPGATRIS